MDTLFIMIIKSILMGIVEGVTEFLPVSSTGHLIVTGELIGFSENLKETFEIVIQLGAILAVVWYYRVKIIDSIKEIFTGEKIFTEEKIIKGEKIFTGERSIQNKGFKLWINILVAFLPSAVIGLIFHKNIKALFNSQTVAWAIIVGAVLLYIVQKVFNKPTKDNIDNPTIKSSLIIGFCQCLAMIPGMSRSGSTIMGGIIAGYNVKAAAEFSFFLAIPTMFAASGYEMLKGFSGLTGIDWIGLATGFIVSFIVALVVVDKFLTFLGKHSMNVFIIYRLFAGIVLLALMKFGII